MRLSFLGAAHEVTGSCYLVETEKTKLVIDCGMFQGSDFNEGKNFDAFPFVPGEIAAVLVTHAHLDHTGRIPKLVKDGFRGPIIATKATIDLMILVWKDAYEIMRYNHEKFQLPFLYDEQDIAVAVSQCKGVDYHEEKKIGDTSLVWKDTGHIFGASFITVHAEGKNVVFSGDVGNENAPILKDTELLGQVDTLICESTYGDRIHESQDRRDSLLLGLLQEACQRGGTIMMPAFSIERTQEILYNMHELSEEGKLPKIPIFLDSPLAIDALTVYKQYPEYYDREAIAMYKVGNDFFSFPELRITRSREESKMINSVHGPKMVIAGSGMMNGGRILHHLLRYLPDVNSTLIIVGYQAQGTLGRKLYEGAERVTVLNESIPVRAKIKAIGSLSAHADQQKLVSWISHAEKIPEKVYCTHGEPTAATALAHRLRDDLHIKTFVPERGETVEL